MEHAPSLSGVARNRDGSEGWDGGTTVLSRPNPDEPKLEWRSCRLLLRREVGHNWDLGRRSCACATNPLGSASPTPARHRKQMTTDRAMKTITEHLREQLVASGLWPAEAEAVLQALKANDKTMEHQWNDYTADYPSPMIAALWCAAKRHALEWIETNKPQHWAKPMFESK
jgi:hypothetical protein